MAGRRSSGSSGLGAPARSATTRLLAHRTSLLAVVVAVALATASSILPGCHATSITADERVRLLRLTDAALVSDPRDLPGPGFAAFPLGTGLGSWSAAEDLAYGRSDHGVVSVGSHAYIFGGMAFDSSTPWMPAILRSVVRYDMDTGLADEMRPLPQPRTRFAYTHLNGKIYVMGGANDSYAAAPSRTVYLYDIAADNWSAPAQLTTPRADACSAAFNGKVYVFGGYDNNYMSVASVEVCSPPAGPGAGSGTNGTNGGPALTCKQLPAASNMRVPRGDCRAAVVGGLIYVMGGSQWYNNTEQDCINDNWVYCYRFLSSVEAFNPSSGKWTRRKSMISARGDFGLAVLPGGRLLVAGGERSNGTRNFIAMAEVEEYVVQHDVWVAKASLPRPRFRYDMSYDLASGRAYALGGTPTCDLVADAPCYKRALSTVPYYTDVPYPNLYIVYKPANVSNGP